MTENFPTAPGTVNTDTAGSFGIYFEPVPVTTNREDVPPGWYVQIERQYSPLTLAVGPYPSQDVAESAFEESILVDGLCQEDCLDASTADADNLEQVVALALIDHDDPNHHGPLR